MGLLDNLDLNDPKTMGLLNLGLGILSGNTGRPGDMGQGLMGGMQNYQQMMQQQQLAALRKQQQDMQAQEFGWKKQQFEDEQNAPLKVGNTLLDRKTMQPIYTAPSAAADPYFQYIPTDAGLIRADVRSNGPESVQLVTNPETGKPYIKSADSPMVRGAVKGAEAQAAANWKPNTDIPGMVSTDAQVAGMANGLPSNNFSQPVTWSGPMFGAPGTTATDRIEGTTGDIPLRNPANPRGIRIPTAAQLAAEKKAAEVEAEDVAKTKTGLSQAVSQAEDTIRLVDEMVGSEDGKIKRHPGFETAVGMSSKLDPRNYLAGTDATAFNTRLDQLKGKQFLQAFESLKGGGQITEVEGKKATDAISRMNTATTEDEFVTAARDFQRTIRGAVSRSKQKAGGQQKGPMRGQVVDGYKFKGGDPADSKNWEKQ